MDAARITHQDATPGIACNLGVEKAATQARAQALRALREPYRIFYYKAGRGTDLCTTHSGRS